METSNGWFDETKIRSTVNPSESLKYSFDGATHEMVLGDAASIYIQWDESQQAWDVVDIHSYKPGEGARMVREFVNIMGPNVNIFSTIIEPRTISKLENIEHIKTDVEGKHKTIKITDRKTLDQLKMVQVFEEGGVKTQRVEVGPFSDPEQPHKKITVSYFGRT